MERTLLPEILTQPAWSYSKALNLNEKDCYPTRILPARGSRKWNSQCENPSTHNNYEGYSSKYQQSNRLNFLKTKLLNV